MKTYYFDAKNSDLADFDYAYSPMPKEHKQFEQREECLANYSEADITQFDYVSIITKKRYATGVKISTKCSFGNFGAPLIVFSDDISSNQDGSMLYGLHFEVVAYEDGCNIWHIVPDPNNEARPIKTQKIGYSNFKIQPDEMIDMSVEIVGKRITANVNGNVLSCEHEDVPMFVRVGLTGCEGPNRFYEFAIEELT